MWDNVGAIITDIVKCVMLSTEYYDLSQHLKTIYIWSRKKITSYEKRDFVQPLILKWWQLQQIKDYDNKSWVKQNQFALIIDISQS